MRNYEGVFILDPDMSQDTTKTMVTGLQDLVTKNGGRVDGLQEWGRRKLAYKINKKQDGHYVLINFQMDSLATKKMQDTLRLNDSVMRYLMIVKDAV